MSWAYGEENGRAVGYGVLATCDRRGCHAEIDRGLAHRCGPYPLDGGCGLYFCDAHLGTVGPRGGCRHRGGPWGRNLSCMAQGLDGYGFASVCLYRAAHDGLHAYEADNSGVV